MRRDNWSKSHRVAEVDEEKLFHFFSVFLSFCPSFLKNVDKSTARRREGKLLAPDTSLTLS